MIINNGRKVKKLKRIFFLVCVLIAVVALALFLLDFTIYGLAMVGVFAFWFLFFQVADFQYIEFKSDNQRVVLRYYKAVSFGKTEFSSIEFPGLILKNAFFENSVFGKMTDLTLVVNTKKGVAEYPSVSLTAVSKEDRKKIEAALNQILGLK